MRGRDPHQCGHLILYIYNYIFTINADLLQSVTLKNPTNAEGDIDNLQMTSPCSLSHSYTLWSPIQGDILGSQGCLGSTSEGQSVQVQSSPFSFSLPTDLRTLEVPKTTKLLAEDTHSVQELSLRNGHRWSGWVWAKETETGRNSTSMGGKGEREENAERWACRGLVQGQVGPL